MDKRINPVVLRELEKLSDLLVEDEGLECIVELVDDGVLLQGNRAALLHIANRILGIVENGKSGSHITIDRADIAPDAEVALTIGLIDS